MALRSDLMPTLDKATLDAVKNTKKEAHATLSHRRQMARATKRKKDTLQVVSAKSAAASQAVRERQEAASALTAQREAVRTQRVVNPPQRSVGSQVRSRATTTAINAGSSVASSAVPSSNSGLIMTTIFVIVGLALFYNVVTKADQFSGFVGGLGDFLHKLSSTTPLFQVTTK